MRFVIRPALLLAFPLALLLSGCSGASDSGGETHPDQDAEAVDDVGAGSDTATDTGAAPDTGTATDTAATDTGTATDTAAADTGAATDTAAADTGAATDTAAADTGAATDTAAADTGTATDTTVTDTGTATDTTSDTGTVVPPPTPTAVILTSTYFRADGASQRGTSAWATASYPGVQPENTRSTVFWGRFQQNACATPGYGLTVEHALAIPDVPVFSAFYPDCAGDYGPSVEADVYAHDAPQHLLRTEVRPAGAFQTFGSSGQNASGANAYIQAAYTQFNPSWYADVPHRLRPWGGPSTDPAVARFALRAQESVTRDLLEAPNSQQLQQVLRMLVINEDCVPADSSSYCQIEFNFKTYNRGVGAYTSFTEGDVFNDAGQGGLIAVVGPIAGPGQSTQILGSPAWTSWGSATQLLPFQDEMFQVEMSWDQFQQLLLHVTAGDPAAVFGASWQNRQRWILLRIGYGQENYNPSPTASSLVEGLFESIEVFAL